MDRISNKINQFELNLDSTNQDCATKIFKYTVGITKKNETLWWVSNDSKNKKEYILNFLFRFPNSRPTQSNYKFYKYHLTHN